MRVLLVNPKTNKSLFVAPPIGLVYLASSLKTHGHEPKIIDLYSFGGPLDDEDLLWADMICITGMSMQHNSIINTARSAKLKNPNINVVVGGSHATALPALLTKETTIDAVLRGEADEQLINYIDALEGRGTFGDVKGLCTELGSSPPTIVEDVDSLSMPDWNLVDLSKYKGKYHGFFYDREPVGLIYSSRGCPGQCTFCSRVVGGNKWRPHSPDRVLDEVKVLIEEHNVQEIHFEDDSFTLDRERAGKILRSMSKLDISIGFPNGVRLDTLTDDLLRVMKASGVNSITCGIEFGSQKILNMCKKGLSLEGIERQVNKIKSHGLRAQGFFIIGYPHETKRDINMTIELAKRLDLDAAFFGCYVPLPGSEDFGELLSTGKIKIEEIDWDTLFSVEAHDVSYHLSKREIVDLKKIAYRSFYFRPGIILKVLSRVNSMKQFNALLDRARGII